MIFGYARVSTKDQNLQLQIDALKRHGVDCIIKDKISTRKVDRLDRLLFELKAGDTLVIWKLDRLGRNLHELLDVVDIFHKKKVNFVSLKENIDTETPLGKFFFALTAAITELERDNISMRTIAGLESARSLGHRGGRPSKKPEQISNALCLYRLGFPLHTIKDQTTLTSHTLYKYLHQKVIDLYTTGFSIDEIADSTKYSKKSILNVITKRKKDHL